MRKVLINRGVIMIIFILSILLHIQRSGTYAATITQGPQIGGNNTAVQFNNNGGLAGESTYFNWDTTAKKLNLVSASFEQEIGSIDAFTPPYQYTPIAVNLGTAGIYTNSGTGNNFHLSSWIKGTGTRPTVAVFGEGVADGAGAQVWGGNFVAYANNATGTAHGVEINWGVLASGGTAYGLVLASAGDFSTQNAIQIQANTSASRPSNGIVFSMNGTITPVTAALISTVGNLSGVPYGIDFSGTSFQTDPIRIKNDTYISSKNYAGTGNISLIGTDSTDTITINRGTLTGTPDYNTIIGGGVIELRDGGNTTIIHVETNVVGIKKATDFVSGDSLVVNGPIRILDSGASPACTSSAGRGTMRFVNGTPGNKDTFQICAKDATDTYNWRNLY